MNEGWSYPSSQGTRISWPGQNQCESSETPTSGIQPKGTTQNLRIQMNHILIQHLKKIKILQEVHDEKKYQQFK